MIDNICGIDVTWGRHEVTGHDRGLKKTKKPRRFPAEITFSKTHLPAIIFLAIKLKHNMKSWVYWPRDGIKSLARVVGV